jgi:hypothetical protein
MVPFFSMKNAVGSNSISVDMDFGSTQHDAGDTQQ